MSAAVEINGSLTYSSAIYVCSRPAIPVLSGPPKSVPLLFSNALAILPGPGMRCRTGEAIGTNMGVTAAKICMFLFVTVPYILATATSVRERWEPSVPNPDLQSWRYGDRCHIP